MGKSHKIQEFLLAKDSGKRKGEAGEDGGWSITTPL